MVREDYTESRIRIAFRPQDARFEITSELRSLVDMDLLPPGTTLAAGDGPGQQLAHVLPDGRLYADGETYDRLLELSDALDLTGNPWTLWAAELPDGRVSLHVLRETLDVDRPHPTDHAAPSAPLRRSAAGRACPPKEPLGTTRSEQIGGRARPTARARRNYGQPGGCAAPAIESFGDDWHSSP
ncbi:MAG: hypothetical protein ACREX8_17890, partial [Gammaproteobacteria bacterium]